MFAFIQTGQRIVMENSCSPFGLFSYEACADFQSHSVQAGSNQAANESNMNIPPNESEMDIPLPVPFGECWHLLRLETSDMNKNE